MTTIAKFPGTCRKCGQPISVGQKIEWEKGRGASHVECPKGLSEKEAPYRLAGGSGYGCQGWRKGQIVACPQNVRRDHPDAPDFLFVVAANSQYVREDGMSFGVGDEDGYIYTARARAATEEEAAPLVAKIRQRQEAKERAVNLSKAFDEIRKNGKYLPGDHSITGTRVPIGEGQMIHGGGQWFVIGEDRIWAVTNNGADGDDWSRNNVRTGGAGAIGFCVPFSQELADRILANGTAEKG